MAAELLSSEGERGWRIDLFSGEIYEQLEGIFKVNQTGLKIQLEEM